ncbi:MAG: SGNH/GDSL hydrolase family protein [Planctomycetota bacterium]
MSSEARSGRTLRERRRRRFRCLFLLVLLPLVLELGAYAAGRVLQSKWAMHVDPLRAPKNPLATSYTHYLEIRHPELGWPTPQEFGSGDFEPDGSIVVPFNHGLPPDDWWISLYGDSYTYGLCNTDPAHAWPNELATLGGHRVVNYGLGGYGSDQAHRRFVLNAERDHAEVAILGHMSEDITRNLTRLIDFKNGGVQSYAFKPRYVLDEAGHLELVPLPTLSEEEYLRVLGVRGPALPLEHESLQPGGPAGAVRLTFPFTLALLRNLGYWRFQSRIGGFPEYLPFYDPEHPLGGYALTREILEDFHRRALARGQRPLVILFPDPMHLRHQRKTGVDLTHPLAEDLRSRGVDVLEFSRVLLGFLGERPVDAIFCDYHYMPEVNPLIARTIYEHLQAQEKR